MNTSGVSVARDTVALLKGQHTKSHLQPLTLGSSGRRAEWTTIKWGESGVGGSGERDEGYSPIL